jgi:Bacterial membrane protein YfhO
MQNLHRWLLTKHSEALQAAALMALVIVLAFGDVVFLGRTLLTSNIAPGTIPSGAFGYDGRRAASFPVLDAGAASWQYEPYVKILHDDIVKGWLPLWDPYVANGAPLLANMASAVLSPMRLLVASIEKPGFWDFYLLARLFLATFFTYLLARTIGIGFAGSFVAGIAFGLSGHFILYVNMADLDVQIWLPVLMLATEYLIRRPAYRTFVVVALLIALIIFGGMPESAFFMFLLAGLYFLVRPWTSASSGQQLSRSFKKALIGFVIAGVVGFLISLPQVLPFVEYLQHAFNPRAPGVGSIFVSLSTAPSLVLPGFFGPLHQTWNGIDSFSILPYVGAVCCFLAIAGLCSSRPNSQLAVFFGGFCLFYLLKSFGVPPVQWIGRLPLFNVSIFPKHAFPAFSLSVAILAGIGVDHLLKRTVNYSRFSLCLVVFSLTVARFVGLNWQRAAEAGVSKNVVRSCVFFAVGLCSTWLLGLAARHFGPGRLLVALGLVLLPTSELVISIPRERTGRYEAFTKPPFVDFLRADQQVYRTFSLDNFLYANTNAAYGIDDVRSLDPLQVRRYVDFLRKDVSPKVLDRFDGTEPDRDFLRSPLLDLLNVKYVLASSEIEGQDLISGLLRDSFVLPTSRWGINDTRFIIDGVSRRVLFQHPPSRIDYETIVTEPTHLKFAFALDPKAWGKDKGSGVVFQVDTTNLSEGEKVFSEYIDPKNRISDRKWHVHSIDLSLYRGREIYLIFRTVPGVTNSFDWAHWAQLPGGIEESLRAALDKSQIIAPPNYVAPTELTIGAQKLKTWGEHPPATVRFRLRIPTDRPTLNFAIGLDPAVWQPEKGDGVTFEILAAPAETLFRQVIDPKNNPQDRKWHVEDIDLSRFHGQRLLLSFHTLPEGNNAYDWAGWGDLRLENEGGKFDLVYDNEVKIYRNKDALPRAFVVNNSEYIADKDAILTRLMQPSFDPRSTVILEQGAPNRSRFGSVKAAANSLPVVFDRYEPNYVRLRATLNQPGWLVLTDTYYPGWKVRVDGQQGRILPADYIFRGVPLESGSHVVEFIYLPTSFALGVAISALTIAVLLLVGMVLRSRRRRVRWTEAHV